MMYHHVKSDRCSNELDVFEKHIAYISQNFTPLFPRMDKLPKNPICLVFDDGYYDFYKYIYPILQKYKVKAILGVVPKYILEETDKIDSQRLNHEHNELFNNYLDGTFCTYKELREMQESGLVQIASHSYSHTNLLEKGVNLEYELKNSKEILQEKLGCIIESFVYPFGKYNQKVLNATMEHYKYSFRIGNAVNNNFKGINGVVYRIDGDFLETPSAIFSFKNILKFKFKALIKTLVGNS